MRRAEEVRTFYHNEATGQQQKQQPASFVSGDEETVFQSGIVGYFAAIADYQTLKQTLHFGLHAGILLFLLLLLTKTSSRRYSPQLAWHPSRQGHASTMRPCSERTRYDINAQVGPDQITAVKWSTGHKGSFYIAIVPGWEAWRLSNE